MAQNITLKIFMAAMTIALLVGLYHTVYKPLNRDVNRLTEALVSSELHQFQVECFTEQGFQAVYYVGTERAGLLEEMKMCKTPSIHGKFKN